MSIKVTFETINCDLNLSLKSDERRSRFIIPPFSFARQMTDKLAGLQCDQMTSQFLQYFGHVNLPSSITFLPKQVQGFAQK